MNDQELKELWQRQKLGDAAPVDARDQFQAMRDKMACLHRGLNSSDLWEGVVRAVVLVVFTIYFFTIPHFVTRIGVLILIGGDLFASWKKIQSRRSTPQPIADAPVIEWLKYDLVRVQLQAELSRRSLRWDMLLFVIGMNVFFWGMPVSLWTKIGPSALAVLVAAFTYWLSQRVRRKQWLPLQEELEALLQQESQAGSAKEHRPSTSARKRNNFIAAGIILVITFAGFFVFRNSQQPELPRAPG